MKKQVKSKAHLNDKDFFTAIKKESSEYSDDITEGFPYFCLKIFWDALSDDQIRDALTGLKTNDESMDAFFVDEENREINIIQCKSCRSEKDKKALKKEWLSYLENVPDKLKDHEFIDTHKNDKIREIAEEYLRYSKQSFKTKLLFFHLGRAGDPSILKHYEGKIKYYGWDEIKEEYQEYVSKLDRTEPPYMDIRLNDDVIKPGVSKKHMTLVSIITGDELIKLRQSYRYKLFDKNLRFGLGQNKINKGIADTAKGEPGNFYFYNNGITITSKGFKHRETNQTLRIEYPQIINGAQTVNAIYDAYKNKLNDKRRRESSSDAEKEVKEEFAKIKILFRVIQDAEKDGRKTSQFEEKVIRYNNSQNSVKETDFYANNPEQIAIQKLMAKFGYFYEIKRGDRKFLDSGKETHNLLNMRRKDFKYWDEKITIETLAIVWMVYAVDPSLAAAKKSSIFGYAQDKYYNLVFDEKSVSEDRVKEMILAWHLFQAIKVQSDIYSNKQRDGQIISKITQWNKDATDAAKSHQNIRDIISRSILFGEMMKKDISNFDTFVEQKENLLAMVREYYFFSKGYNLTLAVIKLIFDKCGYVRPLLDHDLFCKKEFLSEQVVNPWLKIILDELIKKEHAEFEKNIGSSLQTFYGRDDTWKNIQNKFKKLRYKMDKEHKDIFPLALG